MVAYIMDGDIVQVIPAHVLGLPQGQEGLQVQILELRQVVGDLLQEGLLNVVEEEVLPKADW